MITLAPKPIGGRISIDSLDPACESVAVIAPAPPDDLARLDRLLKLEPQLVEAEPDQSEPDEDEEAPIAAKPASRQAPWGSIKGEGCRCVSCAELRERGSVLAPTSTGAKP